MRRLLVLLITFLFLVSGITISNEYEKGKRENERVVATIIFRDNNCPLSTLQPVVVITQPEDGAVVTDPHLVVLGYASDDNGMNYWEWEWKWKGGSKTNSSYFETAEYVEFRIDIYGLHEGWNLITVRFKNIYGATGEDCVNVTYNPSNTPPNKPSTPEGPTEGKVKETLHFNTVTTDPDGDSLEYLIDWGDGTNTGWLDPITSGTPFETFHAWDEPGTYEVKAKARDLPYLEESEWSEPLIVTISGNDTEPPVVVKKYPENGSVFTEPNITAWGYITDNVGVVSYGYTHEWEGGATGSSWPLEEPTTNFSFEIPITLHEGWNKIKIEASDAAGNYGYDEETVYYNISPPDIILLEFYPIQVVKGAGISQTGKISGPELVEKKPTLVEIWYKSTFNKNVKTKVIVKVNGVVVGEEIRTIKKGGPHKLEPWVPPPNKYLKKEVIKPKITIEVEIVPVAGEANINNNKLSGEFKVKKGHLQLFYIRVGRNRPDAMFGGFEQTTFKSAEFIYATYPLTSYCAGYVKNEYRLYFPTIPGKPTTKQEINWLKNLGRRFRVTSPDENVRVVGLVRKGWIFANSPDTTPTTNGFAYPNIPVVICEVDYWTTPAHEIGHTYGLQDHDRSATIYWIIKGILQKEGKCFMGPPIPPKTFGNDWICKECYNILWNKIPKDPPEIMVVSGLIYRDGRVEIDPFYHLSQRNLVDAEIGDVGDYSFGFLDEHGNLLGLAGFNTSFVKFSESPVETNISGFCLRIPWINGTKEIQLRDKDGNVLASRIVSENSPTVTVTHPNGGEILHPGENYTITWEAYDADADELTFAISYSNDSGETWLPIDIDVTGNNYILDTRWLPPGDKCLIKVIATDGVNTGQDISDATFTILSDTTPPTVELVKPRNGLYLNDRKIIPSPFTVIIGGVTIEADADDNIGISNVSFYVDGEFKNSSYISPFTWFWDESIIGRHEIKIVAYDAAGNTAMDEQKVWIFNI
ncbi:MAG: hypothetical protein J7L31_02500 [Thermoplasmata archaeon]|nr:hypothetical protein [Thermoplasmata archaeon]